MSLPKPYHDNGQIQFFNGDCREVLAGLEPESIDAVVTDPPYELKFMGQSWDGSGIAYDVEMWRLVYAAMKPGAHLLAFGGSRTYHRMAVAIEDAGFEIRDQIQWLYGSGFPKSHDVSKAIDKAAKAEREVIGPNKYDARRSGRDFGLINDDGWKPAERRLDTAPATPDAERWQGWGTALKPAHEPLVLARKPFKGTVAANVLEHGTGALNVDASRINASESWENSGETNGHAKTAVYEGGPGINNAGRSGSHTNGRWPANVIFDPAAAAILDAQSGDCGKSYGVERSTSKHGYEGGWNKRDGRILGYGDSGGASRFFYCAKASKAERGEGNGHPTVKPLKLVRYLCRLITPPGGVILDPFFGSGTTGLAAQLEGFSCIGIEQEAEYCEIAVRRLSQQALPLVAL